MNLLISTLYHYIRAQRIINKVFESENLKKNLSLLFSSDFEKDWVGRYWTVVNPYVQDMKNETSFTSVYTYDKDGNLSNSLAIEKWIMDRLNAANSFIINHQLFDILTYKITPLDTDKNYLFVMQNLWFDDLKDAFKRSLWIGGVAAVIAVVLLIIF